jgi:L-threonylcarbamoyladenylate synthase
VIDGGELPGTPSTLVDLRRYETEGEWQIVREGAVSIETVATALEGHTPGGARRRGLVSSD